MQQGSDRRLCGNNFRRRRYFNFTSDRLRKLRNRKPEEIDLDSLRGLTAYDAGLLRAAANAPIQGSSADHQNCDGEAARSFAELPGIVASSR